MTVPASDAPTPDSASSASWRRWVRILLPYFGTALVAIVVSLALQQLLAPALPQSLAVPTAQSAPTSPAAPTVASTAAPTSPPVAEPISRQELADMRAEVERLWAVVYLSRAISQVDDAETALRSNDRQNVDQSLIAVDDSLALAYDRADMPGKDPIREIRRQLSDIRDDLYLRPEGMDTRFTRLRQNMLALVEARQS